MHRFVIQLYMKFLIFFPPFIIIGRCFRLQNNAWFLKVSHVILILYEFYVIYIYIYRYLLLKFIFQNTYSLKYLREK